MTEQFAPPICARIRATRERLKEEAQAQGGREAAREFSQERVAQRVGLSLKAYRAYEKDREPNFARRRDIAKSLGLDENYFEVNTDSARDQLLEEIKAELADLRGEVARLARDRDAEAKDPPARRRSA